MEKIQIGSTLEVSGFVLLDGNRKELRFKTAVKGKHKLHDDLIIVERQSGRKGETLLPAQFALARIIPRITYSTEFGIGKQWGVEFRVIIIAYGATLTSLELVHV